MSDNTIQMLRESGMFAYIGEADLAHVACAVKFAQLVAAAEREVCAVVCDDKAEARRAQGFPREFSSARACAAAIRALGERT